jgi:hypothetical protein
VGPEVSYDAAVVAAVAASRISLAVTLFGSAGRSANTTNVSSNIHKTLHVHSSERFTY